jgi:hypothetical protein
MPQGVSRWISNFAFRRAIHGDKIKPTPERKEEQEAGRGDGIDPNAMKANCCPHCTGTGEKTNKITTIGVTALPRATVDTMAGNSSTWEKPTVEKEEQEASLPSLQTITTGTDLKIGIPIDKELEHGNTLEPSPNNAASSEEQVGTMTSSSSVSSCSRPLPRNMLSSLTASQGDFSISEEHDATPLRESAEPAQQELYEEEMLVS